ncbi:MAG: PEP-CTERM sorting domain-containing protein [Bryobacterales bacterium]|nr:PEP-CTERM sorting domain-containing protein [Bryobacterales bacterium]
MRVLNGCASALGALLAVSGAFGASYDASALGELTGNRDAGNGIAFTTGVSFTVEWTISPISGGYHYTYLITGTTGRGMGVSHFALDTSDNCTNQNGCVTNVTVNGVAVDSSTLVFGANTGQNGNPNFPGNFFGVRFGGQINPSTGTNQLPLTIAFDSNRVPVYGDFYLKLGQGGVSSNGGAGWNTGATNHGSTSILDFIARPDTVTVDTPEPATLAMIGAGLILASLGLRRKV